MPVLRAILHDPWTWKVHAIAAGIALLVLGFAFIDGVNVGMVFPAAVGMAIAVALSFWLSASTYRYRRVPVVDRPDRVEPDRMGTVQVLDPRVAVAVASRNAMGIPVYTPAAESSYDRGGLIGGHVTALNDTGEVIRFRSPTFAAMLHEQLHAALLAKVPATTEPYFRWGSRHHNEAVRILGKRAWQIRDGSVRQINGRWLKADQFVTDGPERFNWGGINGTKTESVRIRIPRDSWLRRDFKHPKR